MSPAPGAQKVCILGLGFVGAAMAVACATAGRRRGTPEPFDVVGIDLPTPLGAERIAALNEGCFPFATTDTALAAAAADAKASGALRATSDPSEMSTAAVIVVDIPLDIDFGGPAPRLVLEPFERAIRTIGEHAQAGALVLVETTVPPGTCEHVVAPILDACCAERGIPAGSHLLAHSYERVMPGEQYLESITSFWRAYSGRTEAAADACRSFLSTVIDTESFPLRRLSGTTASETAKVLENAYRATNIAFVDEWGRFAERAGVDLFEVIDAIRVRPTHQNIRQPGFGVGGYCLTKDPIFAALASTDLLGIGEQAFPMSELALRVNRDMPLHALRVVESHLGSLAGRSLALAGVSYRQDVADTRYSPAETFVRRAESAGATVHCFDPLVGHWHEMGRNVSVEMDECPEVDAVVFSVPHRQWRGIEVEQWLGAHRPFVVDAADCLSAAQRSALATAGCAVYSIGRGPVSR